MTTRSAIAQQVESGSVVLIECTIPTEMTIDEWRRLRSSRPPRKRRSSRILSAAQRVVPLRQHAPQPDPAPQPAQAYAGATVHELAAY